MVYLIALFGRSVFKREAMGGGDIKLACGVGTFLGMVNILWVIFLASFLGALSGAFLMVTGKYRKFQVIPFGVYISLGTVLVFIFQPILSRIYIELVSSCR